MVIVIDLFGLHLFRGIYSKEVTPFFSSPGAKLQVSYCNRLLSVCLCVYLCVNNCFRLLLPNRWANRVEIWAVASGHQGKLKLFKSGHCSTVGPRAGALFQKLQKSSFPEPLARSTRNMVAGIRVRCRLKFVQIKTVSPLKPFFADFFLAGEF